ncbi:OOP family OmpA-OmpF porin [Pseudoduganella flava]|uniref:OOP family OmpA-OmpF porin n=1 Tax=Pseudoduganella flava TaxID=871742 RepID=A0A562PJ28_9BURK|nr:OmpA family protein [Pseudoduganella flava]QGZ42024.1 OmpA family protein [Pseudoduganella flava]TWI44444.1 OOP family OmpA-OmpF porin [Pseudoduganella flava]
MNKSNKIAIAAALLCASVAASAQDAVINPNWYIQPSVNAMKPDSDWVTDKTGYGGGIKFGKPLAENWDIQMGYTYARSKDGDARYQQETLGVDFLYLFSRKTFRPFVLVGLGAQRDKESWPNSTAHPHHTSPYVSAGLGFQSVINDRWSFQADVRDVYGFIGSDEFRHDRSNNVYVTVGFNYALGPTPTPPAPPAPPPAPVAEAPTPVAPPPPPPPPARFEKVTMSATELFEFDSAKLRGDQPKLDEVARVLNENPSLSGITITGHTDRLGSDKYNQKLSERRAAAAKDYLVSKGIAADRLTTQGKGESEPVVQCNEKKRAALIKCLEPNRRVEVEQITIERKVQ